MSNNYDQEKQEYSAKLQRQINTLDKILNIESCGLIDFALKERLNELKEKAKFLKNKLDKEEFEIAIVGIEKAGKSTFANALMGNPILPSAAERCTYTSTKIVYDSSNTATVSFFRPGEYNDKFKKKLQDMTIENASSYNYSTIRLSEYLNLYSKLDENTKIAKANLNEDIKLCLNDYSDPVDPAMDNNKPTIQEYLGKEDKNFEGDELTTSEFQRFITTPKYSLAVKEVKIKSSRLENMQNAIIYDVPGFDSPTENHKVQTEYFMKQADAIVVVCDITAPSIKDSAAFIFNKVFGLSDIDGNDMNLKTFVFGNHADECVPTLSHNLDVLKNELQKYNVIPRNGVNRIVTGSGWVSLVRAGKLDGNLNVDDSFNDGVQSMFNMLEEYNRTERFILLKKKINLLQDDILAEFNKLSEQYSDDSPSSNINNLSSEFFLDLQLKSKNIVEALEDYRGQIKVDYTENAPISQKIKDDVIESINKDNFFVSDEDYKKAKQKDPSSSPNLAPEMIDRYIRETKHQEVYTKFTKGIVDLASKNHEECDHEIISRFLAAIDVSQSNVNYDKIKENVTKFINDSKAANDGVGYYRSLIERFSIDLFDILLLYRLGSDDRWNKYESNMRNFQALAMFDNNRKQEESIANQPLYFKLLFQTEQMLGNYNTQSKISSLISDLAPIVMDFVPGGGPVTKMIGKAVLNPKVLGDVEKYISNNKNKKLRYAEVERAFKGFTDKLPNDGGLNYDSYKHYFAELPKAEETIIREQIEKDFEILHSVLDSVLINAINIEKAFLALEVGNINNIIKGVKGYRYKNFVQQNAPLIRAVEFSNLEAEQQKRLTRKSILNDVKVILEEMNNSVQ